MIVAKPKYRGEQFIWEKQLSDQLRYGTKEQKKALLKWANQRRFNERKPTPEELIAECKRKKSPLYGLMEINPRKAAEKYWRQTAQDIIRHIDIVRVHIKTQEVDTKPVRAWQPTVVTESGHRPEDSYVPTQRVVGNKLLEQSITDRAYNDLRAWLDRYERYDEVFNSRKFLPVVKSIRRLLSKKVG